MKKLKIVFILTAAALSASFIGCEKNQTSESVLDEPEKTTMSPEESAEKLDSIFSEASQWAEENSVTYETSDGLFSFRLYNNYGLTEYENSDLEDAEFVYTYTDLTQENTVPSIDFTVASFADANCTLEEFAEFSLQNVASGDESASISYSDVGGNHTAIITAEQHLYLKKIILVQGGEDDNFLYCIEMKNDEKQLSDKEIENILETVKYNK